MKVEEIKRTFEKSNLIAIKKGSEIFLGGSSVGPEVLSGELVQIIADLTHRYDGIVSFKTSHLPYCIFPPNTLFRNIYYQRDKKSGYIKFSQCKSCQFDNFCPGIIDKYAPIIKMKIKPVPDIPLELGIEITSACNLDCQRCLIDRNSKIDLSVDKIKEVINAAKLSGIEAIRITGGEPLLRKDIFDILGYIKSRGFYVILNTNGTLLINRSIKKLERCVDNILVSVQGYNKKTEDFLTGGGRFFKHKLISLVDLNQSKIDMVRISTVVSRTLMENLNKYYLLMKKLGVKNWVINRPMFPKNTKDGSGEYKIYKRDMVRLLDFMSKLRTHGIKANAGNAVPFCITADSAKRLLLCSNGITEGYSRIVYDVRGFYKPAYTMDVNIGNTLKKALAHPFLKKLKSLRYLPQKCRNCLYIKDCLGGSRYLAREFKGSYFAADPWMNRL